MSQYPRRVLSDTTVLWDRHANGNPAPRFARHGAAVDIPPGSALEAAYGGPGNLLTLAGTLLADEPDTDESEVNG